MFKTITIIGMGLIGSSIARAINKKNLCKRLIVHDCSKSVLKKVLKLKITKNIEANLKKSVKDIGFALQPCKNDILYGEWYKDIVIFD